MHHHVFQIVLRNLQPTSTRHYETNERAEYHRSHMSNLEIPHVPLLVRFEVLTAARSMVANDATSLDNRLPAFR
jgi:hypothetical protein